MFSFKSAEKVDLSTLKVGDIITYLENFDLEDFYSIPPDLRWELEPIKAAVDMNVLPSYSLEELKKACKDLRKLVINNVQKANLPKPARESDYSVEL